MDIVMKKFLLNSIILGAITTGLLGCNETDINYVDFQKTADEPTILANAIESSRTKYINPFQK